MSVSHKEEYKGFSIHGISRAHHYFIADKDSDHCDIGEEKYVLNNMIVMYFRDALEKFSHESIGGNDIDHLVYFKTIEESKEMIDKLLIEKPEYLI